MFLVSAARNFFQNLIAPNNSTKSAIGAHLTGVVNSDDQLAVQSSPPESWPDAMECTFSWSGRERNHAPAFIYATYKFCGSNNKTKFTGSGTRKEFDERVDKWAKSAPKDRSEAARRMKASARENSGWLILAGLPITSLPDISFLRLTSLNVDNTNLATISENCLPKKLP